MFIDGPLSKGAELLLEGAKPSSNPSSPGITGEPHTYTHTYTHTRTHTPFIRRFSLSPHSFTRDIGLGMDVCLPRETFDSSPSCVCFSTCNNQAKLNWSTPLPYRECLYTNTPAIARFDWFPFVCCLFLHLCCWGVNGRGICYIVILLLLTSQFIRWLLGPWWARVFSLPRPLYLPIQREPSTGKKKIGKRG